MSSDDEGYASAEEGVPTASSTNGPVNVTTVPTQTIRDAAATLAPVANGISELSPEQRAQLLQAVQRDPGIIEMIRLKLLDWSDLIDMTDKENPTLKTIDGAATALQTMIAFRPEASVNVSPAQKIF